LKSVYTNQKSGVCIYTSQNAKIPTVNPPIRGGKTVGIFNNSVREFDIQQIEHSRVFLRTY